MPDAPYTADEVDAAVRAISDPQRLRRAEQIVTHAVPGLQRIIDGALQDGGWFSQGHEQQVDSAANEPDPQQRSARLHALLADESRLAMLVGVTVGFELASELERQRTTPSPDAPSPEEPRP
ncbi:hypothetical protein [Patulibacter defluvii]|uniref:hypothetical protein n=1 Tax=Patulibacter defluvii TaxID=3095358 RepID=UPI002A761759|nr:hypothetical protein [Patulibacter sp. DM4]